VHLYYTAALVISRPYILAQVSRSDHLGRSLPASNAQVTTIVDLGIRLVDGKGSVECLLGDGGRKGGSFVSFNWQETREQRDRFIRAVYDLTAILIRVDPEADSQRGQTSLPHLQV
jgi:hypothetical protein